MMKAKTGVGTCRPGTPALPAATGAEKEKGRETGLADASVPDMQATRSLGNLLPLSLSPYRWTHPLLLVESPPHGWGGAPQDCPLCAEGQ